jgi:2-(3-amino-3-carboxypropyl)histidine synthase
MRHEINYDLEIDRIINTVNKEKAKQVLIQLPEGLKIHALKIVNEIESKTKAECIIWLDTCYGACDLPDVDVDLLVQFGHSGFL